MDFWALLITALGVSMDAFAVSLCKGMSMKKATFGASLTCGAWFGGFQALMPLIGFALGSLLSSLLSVVDHWIAFALLAFIGGNMLKEAFEKGCDCCENQSADLSFKTMFVMAVATSVDAMAVGFSLSLGGAELITTVLLIGVITFATSAIGVQIGSAFGAKLEKKAQVLGGVILIGMGLWILIEHLVEHAAS